MSGSTRFWSARAQHDLALFHYFVVFYKISIMYLDIEHKHKKCVLVAMWI
jgi:hypothetical protein